MSGHKLSMSKASIARWCAWWAQPGLDLPWDPPGPPARFGNAFHAGASAHVNGVRLTEHDVAALARKLELDADGEARLAVMLAGWIQRNPTLGADGWQSEVALALDPVAGTARVLGRDIGRGYKQAGLRSTEIPGAVDLLSVEGELVVVRDIKTGNAENVDNVADNGQLNGLALAAARAFGATRARVELEFVDGEGASTIYAHELDAFDLDAISAEFADIWARMHDPKPVPVAGAHCRWCPARTICPEQHAAAVAIVPADDRRRLPIVTDSRGFQSAEHAAWQVETLRKAKVVFDAAKTALEAYADERGGIDLGDGTVYAGKETSREYVNQGALRVAANMLAERSGRSVAEELEELTARARAAGGIKTSHFTNYQPRRAS